MMSVRTLAAAVAAALALPSTALAGPDAEAVRLDDLVAVAVQQSAGLIKARADRTIAQAEADAAGLDRDWITTAEVGWRRFVVGEQDRPPPLQLIDERAVTGSVGVAKKVPTGGQLTAQFGLAQTTQEYDVSVFALDPGAADDAEFADNAQASATLKFEQPLLRGLGPAAAGPQRRARVAAEGANIKAQLAAEELLRELVTSYWELGFAAQELQARKASLALANEQYEDTKAARRVGAVPENALRAVEYELAVREESLLRAQLEVEARSLELRRISGLEVSRRDIVLIPGEPFEADGREVSIDDALDLALADNPRLQALLADKRLADLEVELARDGAKPQVNLAVAGTLFGDGATSGEAVGALGSTGGYELTANLSFAFELGASHRGATRAATERREKVVTDAKDLRRMIEVEVVQAVHAVTAAQRRTALAEKAMDVARNNLRSEVANFRAARTSNFDVLKRQEELVEGQIRKARAIADYHIAVAKLEFLTGTLLDRYGVEVRARRPTRRDR